MSALDEQRAAAGLAALTRPTFTAAASVHAEGVIGTWERFRAQALALGRAVPDPDRVLADTAACGARLVLPGDPEWPAGLQDLSAAPAPAPPEDVRRAGRDHGVPFGLWVRGSANLAEVTGRSAALVGARAATGYGVWAAGELAAGLVEREVAVISGGAFGIDGAAHRGAIAAGGVSVAVLPGGIDVPYPAAHAPLFAEVVRRGVLVAEQPPGRRPRREGFLVRNRLIAALAGGVVLVEAALRSGARNTMVHAAVLGRPRMVVPGPITSALSAGAHLVLRQDPEARLVTSAADILEEIGRLGVDLAPPQHGPTTTRDDLADDARAVLDVLPATGTWSAGRISAETAVPVARVLGLAGALVDHGLLERSGQGFRLTELGRTPTSR